MHSAFCAHSTAWLFSKSFKSQKHLINKRPSIPRIPFIFRWALLLGPTDVYPLNWEVSWEACVNRVKKYMAACTLKTYSPLIAVTVPKCILREGACHSLSITIRPYKVSDTRVALQTCISNAFCQVGLYSFDGEWLMGCECGQEPWFTNPVWSEGASGKGWCMASAFEGTTIQNIQVHASLYVSR